MQVALDRAMQYAYEGIDGDLDPPQRERGRFLKQACELGDFLIVDREGSTRTIQRRLTNVGQC
jgi:hypothetical protein